MSHIRTAVAYARGLGASGHGVGHWIHQRVTAVMLIPLSVWLISWALGLMMHPNVPMISNGVQHHAVASFPTFSLLSMICLVLFVTTALYHGMLGMKVVIEDYTPNLARRFFYIILVYMITWSTIIAAILGALVYYVPSFLYS